jgi:hypothetical protein
MHGQRKVSIDAKTAREEGTQNNGEVDKEQRAKEKRGEETYGRSFFVSTHHNMITGRERIPEFPHDLRERACVSNCPA